MYIYVHKKKILIITHDRLWKSLQKSKVANVDPDIAADMYEETVQRASDHGFAHYEVSSYARNRDAISTHNFSYWQGMDYLGEFSF